MTEPTDFRDEAAKAMYEHDLTWVASGTAFKPWEETSVQDIYRARVAAIEPMIVRATIEELTVRVGTSPVLTPDNKAAFLRLILDQVDAA